MQTAKKNILTKEAAEKKLRRMALEITERNYNETGLELVGIKENGLIIADKMAGFLKDIFGGTITVTALTMDKKNPASAIAESPVSFEGKVVLLMDDVANSGRTMLYALQPLLKGYPKSIQTLALVERTHKSFPIALDYVGMSFSTTLDEHITVEVDEDGQVLGAWM